MFKDLIPAKFLFVKDVGGFYFLIELVWIRPDKYDFAITRTQNLT